MACYVASATAGRSGQAVHLLDLLAWYPEMKVVQGTSLFDGLHVTNRGTSRRRFPDAASERPTCALGPRGSAPNLPSSDPPPRPLTTAD